MELIIHHQLEEFRKGQKETLHVWPPPRILLSGFHLGWTRLAPPGRTLSQNDWLKTTRKLIPSSLNPRHQAMWQSCSSGFPYPTALHLGALPFPIKSLALSAHVSPRTIHFWVLDKSPVLGPGRVPPSFNNSIYKNQWVTYHINRMKEKTQHGHLYWCRNSISLYLIHFHCNGHLKNE